MKPAAYLHTLDITDGIPGNEPHTVVSLRERHPFGEPGVDFSHTFSVTTEPLFSGAQIESLRRRIAELESK